MTVGGYDWLTDLAGGHILTAYLDSAGVPTIGPGLTRYFDGRRVRLGDSFTLEQSRLQFALRVSIFEIGVSKQISTAPIEATPCQFDALVSFAFNIGFGDAHGGAPGFNTSSVLKLILAGVVDAQLDLAFMKWKKVRAIGPDGRPVAGRDGKRILVVDRGLVRRRLCEIEVFHGRGYPTQGGIEHLWTETYLKA